jgi:hypothetical protein
VLDLRPTVCYTVYGARAQSAVLLLWDAAIRGCRFYVATLAGFATTTYVVTAFGTALLPVYGPFVLTFVLYNLLICRSRSSITISVVGILAMIPLALPWLTEYFFVGSPAGRSMSAALGYSFFEVRYRSFESLWTASLLFFPPSFQYREYGVFHYLNDPLPYPVNVALLASLPLMVLASLFTPAIRGHRLAPFLVTWMGLAIFLSKGPNAPGGQLYAWAFYHLPFANLFHEPLRFGFITVLIYALVAPASVEACARAKRSEGAQESRQAAPGLIRRISSALLYMAVFLALVAYGRVYYAYGYPRWVVVPKAHRWASEWIREHGRKDQLYRVMPVPFSKQVFILAPWSPNIIYAGAFTPLIHGRPLLLYAPWEISTPLYSHELLGYIDNVIRQGNSPYIARLVGELGSVRYVIVPPALIDDYPSLSPEVRPKGFFHRERETVLKQRGLQVAATYHEGPTEMKPLVLYNEYWKPLVSATTRRPLFVSGLGIFEALYRHRLAIELDQMAPLFAGQLEGGTASSEIDRVSPIVFYNADLLDLAYWWMPSWSRLAVSAHANRSRDMESDWILSFDRLLEGHLLLGGLTIATKGTKPLSIPFAARRAGPYYVLLRVLHGPQLPKLDVRVDGRRVGEFELNSLVQRFKWLRMGPIEMSKGFHTVQVTNRREGTRLDLDVLVVAPVSEYKAALRMFERKIGSRGDVVRLWDAVALYDDSVRSRWDISVLGADQPQYWALGQEAFGRAGDRVLAHPRGPAGERGGHGYLSGMPTPDGWHGLTYDPPGTWDFEKLRTVVFQFRHDGTRGARYRFQMFDDRERFILWDFPYEPTRGWVKVVLNIENARERHPQLDLRRINRLFVGIWYPAKTSPSTFSVADIQVLSQPEFIVETAHGSMVLLRPGRGLTWEFSITTDSRVRLGFFAGGRTDGLPAELQVSVDGLEVSRLRGGSRGRVWLT